MPDTLLSDEALRALNARLEPSDPREIVRWALEESGLREIALASAFQAEGTCVMHMATQIRPDVPVLFLETGFHFEETLAFKRRLTELLDLNVVELTGAYTPTTQREVFVRRAIEFLERAVVIDPSNQTAVYNLELALKLLRASGSGVAGSGDTRSPLPSPGAGSATSGSGF